MDGVPKFIPIQIYNALITRGYTVFAGKTYKGEIDFVAVRDGKKCFIEVAYLLASEETVKREFGASAHPKTNIYTGYTQSLPLHLKLTTQMT